MVDSVKRPSENWTLRILESSVHIGLPRVYESLFGHINFEKKNKGVRGGRAFPLNATVVLPKLAVK